MKITKYLRIAGLALLTLSLAGIVLAQIPDSSNVVPVPEIPAGVSAILGWVLFGLSELFAYIPAMKSNSVLQLVFSLLKKLIAQKG